MDKLKDKNFKANATGVSLVEFFWGLGFPVLMESTFLQIFLKNLGASDFFIGLVPGIFITGISILPLVSSYYARNHKLTKIIVLNLHVVSSLAIVFFGISLFFMETPVYILSLFFISYAIFSLCIGLTLPVWLNYIIKLFSKDKNVAGLGFMMGSQNVAKLISSFVILKTVEAYSFSTSTAAYIFLFAGLMFLIGSLFFIFTREFSGNEEVQKNRDSFFRHTRNTVKEVVQNKNFLRFIAGDLDNYILFTTMSFYAVYATQFYSIKPATAAGLFVGFTYTGSIVANMICGPLNFMSLRGRFLSTKVLLMTGLLILIFFPTLVGFLCSSFIFGLCRGTRSVIFSPSVKMFSRKEDSTGYFAITPLLTMVFGSGLPIAYGIMLDALSNDGAMAYKIMFSISIFLLIIIFYFGFTTDFDNN